MKKLKSIYCQLWLSTLLVALVCLLSACSKHDTPILHTTISADGQMVATLLHAGTDEQLLRVRTLNADTDWQTVQAPPFTQTIRFGLQGHELLLTHRRPAPPEKDYLSKMDLDQLGKGLQRIYESEDGLAFPVEVKPDQVMVRTKHPVKQGTFFKFRYFWILVGPDQQVKQTEPESAPPYGNINIVGSGYFWTEDQTGADDDAHPKLLRYPLPGGRAPEISGEHLEKNTTDLFCDRSANRCLRKFISNLGQGGKFIYDVDVMFGGERCKVPGVAGFGDSLSITSDGNAAVMSLASGYDQPRHVVVMRFKPQQCGAISVQHISFKEK